MGGAHFKNGVFSLSELGDYGFWSRDVIDARPEDFEALESGTMTEDRQLYLACAGMAARDRLAEARVPGVQDWMSPARRLN